MEMLERRIQKMEDNNRILQAQLQELRMELDLTVKKVIESRSLDLDSGSSKKLNYLEEVNEQMFQQNVRLRVLIETCIDQKLVPTQEEYYTALREDKIL